MTEHPELPNERAVELHDSTVTAKDWEGSTLILHGTVYVHASDGVPGSNRGVGWFQQAEISIGNARVEHSTCEGPLEVLDGIVRVDSHVYENLLPLPFEHSGSIKVELRGTEGGLHVSGSHVKIVLAGDPGEVEMFEGER